MLTPGGYKSVKMLPATGQKSPRRVSTFDCDKKIDGGILVVKIL